MSLTFKKKFLRTEIRLADGTFNELGNTYTNEIDFAIQCSVIKPGLPSLNKCFVSIYNVPPLISQQLTTLSFLQLQSDLNLLSVYAVDEDAHYDSLVFRGEIYQAFAANSSQPDPFLSIEAQTGYYPYRIIAPPLSIDGDAFVESLIAQQARLAGYNFVNNGFSGSLKNCVFTGSPLEKAIKIARHAGANLIVDDNTLTLQDWHTPANAEVPLINVNTGLLDYPQFDQDGIVVKTVYRPDIVFNGLVQVESEVPKATGTWRVIQLAHNLNSNLQGNGDFITTIKGQYIDGR